MSSGSAGYGFHWGPCAGAGLAAVARNPWALLAFAGAAVMAWHAWGWWLLITPALTLAAPAALVTGVVLARRSRTHRHARPPVPAPSQVTVGVLGVWRWTCRPCALASVPVPSPGEAHVLAAVHDLVHHGSARTALVARH